MQFCLFLEKLVNDQWEGRVIELPRIIGVGNSKAILINSLRKRIESYVENGPLEDILLSQELDSERRLEVFDVDIIPKKALAENPILLSLDAIVTRKVGRRSNRQIVVFPHVPEVTLAINNPNELETITHTALVKELQTWSITELDALDRVTTCTLETIEVESPSLQPQGNNRRNRQTHSSTTVLDECGINLLKQVETGQLGHFDSRDDILTRVISKLAQKGSSSLILVGPSGVGKTALVEEIARRIHSNKVPESLRTRSVWFVTANSLIAGQQYTGQWQGQTKRLIELASQKGQILFMGNPNEVLDAGRWSKSDNNMGRFLRPYMENGAITVICECSSKEYDAACKLEPSFVQAMQRVDILEPSAKEALSIVKKATEHLTHNRKVSFDSASIKTVMDLTKRFLPYQVFPGKAVSLLKQIVEGEQDSASDPQRNISNKHILKHFAETTGLPHAILSDSERLDPDEVRQYFGERLLGQPEAVKAISNLITVLKAGLTDPNKPLGTFFFVGPTGVGKTELAKVLAEYLFGTSDRLVRFDMSEYSSSDALPRLIGTAWQKDSEGELTRRVREQPFSIILLDEFEKASPIIFDALLSVLGEGHLTNAAGRTTDFRNTIIIMTSNLGAAKSQSPTLGFGTDLSNPIQELHSHYIKEAEKFFRPEFFNRIDQIVCFRNLSYEAMGQITRRELDMLLEREGIQRRNLLVEIDDAVIGRLLAQGFHPKYGARPLKREIERTVIVPLASLLVRKEPDSSQLLRFAVRNDKIHLELGALPNQAPLEDRGLIPRQKRQAKALATLLEELSDLQESFFQQEDSPMILAMRDSMNQLLEESHSPTFWENPPVARQVLSRIYHLDRMLNRLSTLLERCDRLIVKVETMMRQPPQLNLVDKLEKEREKLEADYSYWKLECAGISSSGKQHDRVLLRFAAIGAESMEWMGQLVELYETWASRKGYECLSVPPDRERRAWGLCISGSNLSTILQGEVGLHKLNHGSTEQRERHLVRLSLLMIPEALSESDTFQSELHTLMMSNDMSQELADTAHLVRIYTQGRHASVRDPRTGIKIKDIKGFFKHGKLDEFLLANLQVAAN